MVVVEDKFESLHQMGKGHLGESFRIRSARVVGAVPGSLKYGYFVRLASGEFVFCVGAVFEDEDIERITLKVWHHSEKVIGLAACDRVLEAAGLRPRSRVL